MEFSNPYSYSRRRSTLQWCTIALRTSRRALTGKSKVLIWFEETGVHSVRKLETESLTLSCQDLRLRTLSWNWERCSLRLLRNWKTTCTTSKTTSSPSKSLEPQKSTRTLQLTLMLRLQSVGNEKAKPMLKLSTSIFPMWSHLTKQRKPLRKERLPQRNSWRTNWK